MQGNADTILDVLNLTLNTLGQDGCNSFNPDLGVFPETVAGQKVAQVILKSVSDVQRTYIWQELIATATLSADGVDQFNGLNRFPLPDDCVRPIGAKQNIYSTHPYLDRGGVYTIEGNYLLFSADEILLKYIKESFDPLEWTGELLESIVLKTACDSALNVTGDPKLKMYLNEEYKAITKKAKNLQSKYKRNLKKFNPNLVLFNTVY